MAMLRAIPIILAVFAAFIALAIICAVAIARSRTDVFDALLPLPQGSLPDGAAERSLTEAGTGFSAGELDRFQTSARPASRADQGSGGNGNSLSGAAAARTFHSGSGHDAC